MHLIPYFVAVFYGCYIFACKKSKFSVTFLL